MPKVVQTPFEFFYERAGHSAAQLLADAEARACSLGYTFSWSIDPDIDSSSFRPYTEKTYDLWCCLCRDPEGKPASSLGGIDFGADKEPWGDPYCRIVQAELALEALSSE